MPRQLKSARRIILGLAGGVAVLGVLLASGSAPRLERGERIHNDSDATGDGAAQMDLIRAYPSSSLPEDTYSKAWQHIRRMSKARDIAPPLLPRSTTGTRLWQPVGPAPTQLIVGTAGGVYPNGGVINTLSFDPQDVAANSSLPRRIYIATPHGGIFKSDDGATTWTAVTDDQPSLDIGPVRIHPTKSNLIFAGTGIVDSPPSSKQVGALRSRDEGAHWDQIGPAWPLGAANALSSLAVLDLSVDVSHGPDQTRLWAATSKGLWYSTDAHVAPLGPFVTWHLVSDPATCTQMATESQEGCLPNRQETVGGVTTTVPEGINNFFVSVLNPSVLFVSVRRARHSGFEPDRDLLTGWYRSDNWGDTWKRISTGPISYVGRAAFAHATPDSVTDLLYTIQQTTPTSCPDGSTDRPRLYRGYSSVSATLWEEVPTGVVCEGLRSIAIDPEQSEVLALGAVYLYRSTNAGVSFEHVDPVQHADHNALEFTAHDVLFDGNDGGLWKTDVFSSVEVPPYTGVNTQWTNLNSNLPDFELYGGDIPALNYGASFGGTQDNSAVRGMAPALWTDLGAFGDTARVVADPGNSNVAYFTGIGDTTVKKSASGVGGDAPHVVEKADGLPSPPKLVPHSLAIDPNDFQTLFAFSTAPADAAGRRVYRTRTAAEGPAAWQPISQPMDKDVYTVAVSPSDSSVVFAGTCGAQLWRSDGPQSFAQVTTTLPTNMCVTSIAIDTTQPCTTSSCLLYLTASGFGPGHVFRCSNDAANPTGPLQCFDVTRAGSPRGLPNVVAWKIVIAPRNRKRVYVGTDMGLFQGACSSRPSTRACRWYRYTYAGQGFPTIATVYDLALHPDSGIVRVFTYGRSVWEARLFTPPNPDRPAGTQAPATGVIATPRLSGNPNAYAVAWADDRTAAGDPHAFARFYAYNLTGTPLAATPTDVRVDDATLHHVQAPAIAVDGDRVSAPYTATVAWADDRLGASHIYFQQLDSTGTRRFAADQRADQLPTGVDATEVAIASQPQCDATQHCDFALVWQAQHVAGDDTRRDVFGRFFTGAGTPKGVHHSLNALPPSGTVGDARSPTIAADAAGNAFVAWEEQLTDASTGASVDSRIMIAKLSPSGAFILPPVRADDDVPNTLRAETSLATDDTGQVMIAWMERLNPAEPEQVVGLRCANDLTQCAPLDGGCRRCRGGTAAGEFCQADADCPGGGCGPVTISCSTPSLQSTARAGKPAVATDAEGRIVVAWEDSVNHPPPDTGWNVFARTFDATGGVLRNDFRIDLADRATTGAPAIAAGLAPKRFVFAWRDTRAGVFNVYTRVVAVAE